MDAKELSYHCVVSLPALKEKKKNLPCMSESLSYIV